MTQLPLPDKCAYCSEPSTVLVFFYDDRICVSCRLSEKLLERDLPDPEAHGRQI